MTDKVKYAEAKEAAEAEKREKEWADAANLERLAKQKKQNAQDANDTVKQIVIHNSEDAGDVMDSADLVNDYLMKQLQNDSRNHLKPKDYIEQLLGKEKGKVINIVSDNTAGKITKILQDGSAQLDKVKKAQEEETGQSKMAIEEQEFEAEKQMQEAKQRIKESEE